MQNYSKIRKGKISKIIHKLNSKQLTRTSLTNTVNRIEKEFHSSIKQVSERKLSNKELLKEIIHKYEENKNCKEKMIQVNELLLDFRASFNSILT